MTNLDTNISVKERSERFFFLIMSLSIVVTILLGFGSVYLIGITSFNAPWWVHVHAVTFIIWIIFYVTQNLLIFQNKTILHRKLGRFSLIYVVWMVIVGLALTTLTVSAGRIPPIFAPAYFLALDWTNIIVFAMLFSAAIINCKRTDWHRRLMLCATICLITPAVARLILISGIEVNVLSNIGALLIYVVVAMTFDWRINGRAHAAYIWGGGALVSMGGVVHFLSTYLPFITLAETIASLS